MYTLEILQAEANRYCTKLRTRGFGRLVPKWGFSVYVDPALHDRVIQAPGGFSAAYLAVGATSKSGHATIFVKLDSQPDDEDSRFVLREQILLRTCYPRALLLSTRKRKSPPPRIVDYRSGLAFVTRRNEWRIALLKS